MNGRQRRNERPSERTSKTGSQLVMHMGSGGGAREGLSNSSGRGSLECVLLCESACLRRMRNGGVVARGAGVLMCGMNSTPRRDTYAQLGYGNG